MTRLSRPALVLGSAAWSGVAVAYFYLAYQIVFVMRIGPTAVVVSDEAGMGLHTGDILALPVSLLAAACVALAVTWAHRAFASPVAMVVRPRAFEQASAPALSLRSAA